MAADLFAIYRYTSEKTTIRYYNDYYKYILIPFDKCHEGMAIAIMRSKYLILQYISNNQAKSLTGNDLACGFVNKIGELKSLDKAVKLVQSSFCDKKNGSKLFTIPLSAYKAISISANTIDELIENVNIYTESKEYCQIQTEKTDKSIGEFIKLINKLKKETDK